MEDTRKPSEAMVEKLLRTQGMELKINDFVRESAFKVSLPFLTSVDTDEEKRRFIEEHMDDENAIKLFTEIYCKYFNATEIMDMISFYKTPTGQKICKTQDKIAMEMISVAQKLVQKVLLKALKHGLKHGLKELDNIDLDNLEDPEKFEELT